MFPLSLIPSPLSTAAGNRSVVTKAAFANTKAVQLDGINQAIAFNTATDNPIKIIDDATTGTLAFWFKVKSTANPHYLYQKGTVSEYFRIFYDSNSGDIGMLGYNGGAFSTFTTFETTGLLSANTWYHFAVTFSKSTNWITVGYLDGTELTPASSFNGSASLNVATARGAMGKSTGGAYSATNFDEVACWDTVLTQAEITKLQSYGNLAEDDGDYTSSASLQRWYRLEDDGTDETGNGVDVTLLNNPTFTDITPF